MARLCFYKNKMKEKQLKHSQQPCSEMRQLFNIKVCNKKDLYCAICNSISSQEILIFPKTVIKKYLQKSCAIQEHCHI